VRLADNPLISHETAKGKSLKILGKVWKSLEFPWNFLGKVWKSLKKLGVAPTGYSPSQRAGVRRRARPAPRGEAAENRHASP
jgi:hypothetical protein